MEPSDLSLVTLQGLRLKAIASTGDMVERFGGVVALYEDCLQQLAADGLVILRSQAPRGWVITRHGRSVSASMLADELERHRAQGVVRAVYDKFIPLNQKLLDLAIRWQASRSVADPGAEAAAGPGGSAVGERTGDASAALLVELASLDEQVQPLGRDLTLVLDRFAGYGPRLTEARRRIQSGEYQWFCGPLVSSYHTVWFELHTDLLATLGLDRATETAIHNRGDDRGRGE